MANLFKPNKAAACKDIKSLKFPVAASPKVDGIRCTIQNGVAMSNSLKPLPSALVQELFGCPEMEGLDGELIYGPLTADNVYNVTNSVVMSHDLPPGKDPDELRFYVFDKFMEGTGYTERLLHAERQVASLGYFDQVSVLCTHLVNDTAALESYEAHHTSEGYEGVMVRDPHGFYKQGRSTVKEGGLLKLKRFEDAEAEIIGVEELMHNENEATIGELGQTKRSSAKEGLVGAGRLGALVVRDLKTGVEFNVGTGFTFEERCALWDGQLALPGSIITYKHFPVGAIDKPRHPVFKGFRDQLDLSE